MNILILQERKELRLPFEKEKIFYFTVLTKEHN